MACHLTCFLLSLAIASTIANENLTRPGPGPMLPRLPLMPRAQLRVAPAAQAAPTAPVSPRPVLPSRLTTASTAPLLLDHGVVAEVPAPVRVPAPALETCRTRLLRAGTLPKVSSPALVAPGRGTRTSRTLPTCPVDPCRRLAKTRTKSRGRPPLLRLERRRGRRQPRPALPRGLSSLLPHRLLSPRLSPSRSARVAPSPRPPPSRSLSRLGPTRPPASLLARRSPHPGLRLSRGAPRITVSLR